MATIRKRTNGTWQAKIRRQGWPQQSKTFPTKKKAQDWAHRLESELSSGQFIDRSAGQRTTLKQLIEIYLVEVTDKRPGEASRVAERARLERFMRDEPRLCAHAVSHLKPDDFEDYRDRRLKEKVTRGKTQDKKAKTVSPATVRRELTLFKRVIDYRKRRLGLAVNPVNTEDVTRPAANDERDVRLTPKQINKLLKECAAARNPWLHPFVELGFETGARRGSLLALTWKDVDLKKRSLLLRGVKNSRNPDQAIDHTVALSPRAIEILSALPRRIDGKVFPITANAFRLAFNRARKKAKLDHFRFHDTRHERVSNLIEAGWSDTAVMAMSGHKDPKSLKRYANLRTDHLADELKKLDKASIRPVR